MSATIYETDFYLWTQQQADLLRQGELSELDTAHLIEEIEDMGASHRHAIESYLANILLHLLKWKYQPERRGASWEGSIENSRHRIGRLLKSNPSLKLKLLDMAIEEYPFSRKSASRETSLPITMFPDQCEFSIEQITGDYWPD